MERRGFLRGLLGAIATAAVPSAIVGEALKAGPAVPMDFGFEPAVVLTEEELFRRMMQSVSDTIIYGDKTISPMKFTGLQVFKTTFEQDRIVRTSLPEAAWRNLDAT